MLCGVISNTALSHERARVTLSDGVTVPSARRDHPLCQCLNNGDTTNKIIYILIMKSSQQRTLKFSSSMSGGTSRTYTSPFTVLRVTFILSLETIPELTRIFHTTHQRLTHSYATAVAAVSGRCGVLFGVIATEKKTHQRVYPYDKWAFSQITESRCVARRQNDNNNTRKVL